MGEVLKTMSAWIDDADSCEISTTNVSNIQQYAGKKIILGGGDSAVDWA